MCGVAFNLALVYGNQGRDAEAEPLYRRSLAIMEKAFGPDSAEVGAGLTISCCASGRAAMPMPSRCLRSLALAKVARARASRRRAV
jgi:hypothetical protein